MLFLFSYFFLIVLIKKYVFLTCLKDTCHFYFYQYFKIFISFTLFLKNILGFLFYKNEYKVGYNLYFSGLYNKFRYINL
jgi:hypothetical protein